MRWSAIVGSGVLCCLLASCPETTDETVGPTLEVHVADTSGSVDIPPHDVAAETVPGDDDAETADDAVEGLPEWFGEDCQTNTDCKDETSEGWCVQFEEGGEKQCTVDCIETCPDGYGCVIIRNAGTDGLVVCAPIESVGCKPCETDDGCPGEALCVAVGTDQGQPDLRCAEIAGVQCPAGYAPEVVDREEGFVVVCLPDTGSCICFGEDAAGSPINGSVRPCLSKTELGECTGTETCEGPEGWSACTAPLPSQDFCDGVDNDCDGEVDEAFHSAACTVENDWGVCQGIETCAGTEGPVCDATPPAEETCDGVDNDCDGEIDDGQLDTDLDGTCDGMDDDDDGDGVIDDEDVCPLTPDPDQADADGDGQGDACDDDDDDDGVPDAADNCVTTANADQADLDGDGTGDVCDGDKDGDGHPCEADECPDCDDLEPKTYPGADEICDGADNDCDGAVDNGFADSDGDGSADCLDEDDDGDGDPDLTDCAPLDPSIGSLALEVCDGIDNDCDVGVDEDFPDTDGDGTADCVDSDLDGDAVDNDADNCPSVANADQLDQDGDGLGDVCDEDKDGDGVGNVADNCPDVANPDQADIDGDGTGDACDDDIDNDGVGNAEDNCVSTPNPDQTDTDGDGQGDVCDEDDDDDTVPDSDDNCPLVENEDQADLDGDGEGDACDDDVDGDGVPDAEDNCPEVPNTDQTDLDGDGFGDVCDDDPDGDGVGGDADCEPLDATSFPGGTEVCDGADNDCNGSVDDGTCDDSEACTTDVCDPADGCSHQPIDGPCDDGNACTNEGTCLEGKCTGAEPISCDDGKACTSDSCDPATGCVFDPDDKLTCDDEDVCTLTDACQAGECVGADPKPCDDGKACTTDSCDPIAGCVFEPDDTLTCDDGNACTLTDACQAGECVGSDPKPCDDEKPCTADSCDPATGCVFDADDELTCDDGDACTLTDACEAGQCVGSNAKVCDDGKPCTTDSCEPATGCVFEADDALTCSDDNVCTQTDVCQAGECVGSNPKSCGDGNPCTDNECDPTAGCVTVNNAASCSDGVFCNGADTCSGGSCSKHAGNPCSGGKPYCSGSACHQCLQSSHCGSVSYGGWSSCGGYSNDCDQSGTKTRTKYTPKCGGGGCSTSTSTESDGCSRNTSGKVCKYGPKVCGKSTDCKICKGGSCQLNSPHFNSSCTPSCGAVQSRCGGSVGCRPAGWKCTGPNYSAYDCSICCQ